LLYSTGPRLGLFVTIGCVALFLVVCLVMLRSGYWLPPAALVIMGLAAYPLWSWRRLEAALFNLRRQAEAMAAQPAWLSGAPTGIRSLEPIARSLSALDQSAERLMQVRRFLSSVLDNLPHPAFVADLGGSIRLANPTAYEAFIDLPKARDEVQPSSTQDSANKWLREFFEGQAGIAELSREIVKTERQIEACDRLGREWLIEIKPLGEPWRLWLVQFVNITRIKALQREREQMLAFLTHDIRSPQVTILSALSQAGNLQTQPWAQTIELEARRGLGLAESYVQWARAEHKPLRLDDTDLGDLCTEVVDSFWTRAEAQSVTIRLSSVASAWVQVDQTLLRRAVANLIENALRFSPLGGRIDCQVKQEEGAFWIIDIRDQGPGVPVAELEQIFEPYVRGAATAKSGADSLGAGLGLAFVRLVSTRHGGAVSVSNLSPSGACFRISLPASI
jgi:signal transduction histidine kinase